MKQRVTSFPLSSRRLSDLWQLTFWRKLCSHEKSKDCSSSSTVEDAPKTCSSAPTFTCTSSTDDDPSEGLCSPPPKKRVPPPCPCPKPPTFHPDAGNVTSLKTSRVLNFRNKFRTIRAPRCAHRGLSSFLILT